jgi:hypothetical protein
MRNNIPIGEDRTRPRKQRQSAGRAAWLVKALCDAGSSTNGSLHRQYDGSIEAPIERYSHLLNSSYRRENDKDTTLDAANSSA